MASEDNREVSGWSSWKLLALVVFLTALLRIIVALLPQAIHVDGATQYLPAAERYYHEGLSAGLAGSMEMPLFPVSIALLTTLTHNFELAARIISLVAGIVTVIPLYYLVRNLFGPKHAALAGILFACCPLFVRNSSEVTKESLFGMFFVFGMWLGWLAISRRKLWMCLPAGIVGALAYMTRPDGLDLFAAWGIWLGAGFLYYLFRDRRQALIHLAAGLVIVLPTLVLGVAYVLHVHHKTGEWTVSEKKSVLRLIQGREAKPDEGKLPVVKKVGLFLGRSLVSLKEVGRELFNELGAVFVLLVILALAMRRGAVFRGNERYLAMLCGIQLIIAYLIVMHFSLFRGLTLVDSSFSGRHLLSLLLALWCWIGWGIVAVERGASRVLAKMGRRMSPERPVLTAVLLSLIFLGMLPVALKGPHADKLADKDLGAWLKAHAPKNVKVMTGDRRIAYYAGLPEDVMVRYPRDWALKFDAALRKACDPKVKATHLCLSDDDLAQVSSQVESAVRKGQLKPVFRTSLTHRENTALYEVVCNAAAPP